MSSTYENNNRLEEPCRQHDIAEGGIRMENTMDSERFLESPELLLNLCRDIVQKLDEKRDDSWREEKEKQFTEVSRTIERLEKSETAIPEQLQSLKTGLLAELSVIVKSNVALERLLEGFDDIIKDIRKRCGGHREVKNQASQNRKQSGPPKIDNVTLRNIIVDLFKGRAGRGHIEQVLFDVEKKLSGQLLPREFGPRHDRQIVRGESSGHSLDIHVGKTVLKNSDLSIELNNTTRHANSHLAIMGKPGVGKTQFLLKILADIRNQSNYQINFIYFDYKGDVADNNKFVEITKAQVYRLLQGGQILPVNPFILSTYDEQTIHISAREKAESFASINAALGVVQRKFLIKAIRAAYARRSGSKEPYPDFRDVLEIAAKMYEDDNKKDDSLIEVLHDLSDFNIFWKHGDEIPPIDYLVNRTLLIDVHSMPVLKELVAYLVIERLYKEMVSLPDSPVADGKRTIRTILVIDEAHNYLSQKNIFLQRIIREGRSKGIVTFFASQSPNDYQQKFFNFQELLEFAFIFQCEGVSANSIQDILGCNKKTAKDLQIEIARLEPWQVITRSGIKTEEFVKFTAEAFYRNHG